MQAQPLPPAENEPGRELAKALEGYARWAGLSCPERAPLWVERLEMNREEISRFRDAPTPQGPAFVAQAVMPEPLPLEGPVDSAPERTAITAEAAWTAARDNEHLRAFTRLPEVLEPAGPGYLSGVPFAVKDLIAVAGMPCSGGSHTGSAEPLPEDGACVAAMKRQGAVFIGLNNLHELAFGASSHNPVFGRVINPAAPDRIPGGSSGGSAAAVAAGIVNVTLATDTGGSVRIPAACCGVVGFKPSYDAVSRDGAIDMSESLDHIGPIGRTVMDCAQAFAALTGLPEFKGIPARSLNGLRVGVLGGFFQEPLDTDVRAALTDIQSVMRAGGAQTHEALMEGIELAAAIQFITISTEAATSQGERLRDDGQRLGEDVRVRLEMASLLPGHWYLKAQRLRRVFVQRMDRLFDDADILLSPTMRSPAPLVGAAKVDIEGKAYPLHTAVSNLTMPFSLSGMPAIAIPWGETAEGAPLSMQLAGARGKDWEVLAIAHRLSSLAPR
ncbi:amidase [Ottowia thiooxydans]|uniref:Asp-tRNA(Asn)/Glu-tRNA(Gln) amidotransferase A subunit family amidase n=1 Tax=Ottowia thiooxydans TaxID=219182 RepID=A0ABV2Q8K0_9BURK